MNISLYKYFGYFLVQFEKISKLAKHHYWQSFYYKKIPEIGNGVRFNGICKITGPERIEIENNVHIGDNAFIRAEGGLFIGENVHIARNLVLYTHSHNYLGKRLPYDDDFIFKKVIIERNAWIGVNVTILPGAHIKEGAIIGAGAVVHGTIEKYSIYGASPAHKIKKRDENHYKILDRQKQYGGISGRTVDN